MKNLLSNLEWIIIQFTTLIQKSNLYIKEILKKIGYQYELELSNAAATSVFKYQSVEFAVNMQTSVEQRAKQLDISDDSLIEKSETNDLKETGMHHLISIKHSMPQCWLELKRIGKVNLRIQKSMLPVNIQCEDVYIDKTSFLIKSTDVVSLEINNKSIPVILVNTPMYKGVCSDVKLNTDFVLSIVSMDNLNDLIIVCNIKN